MSPAENGFGHHIEPKRELTASELNPVYTNSGYNLYPQPAPERYFMPAASAEFNMQAINGEQILADYGPQVGSIVRSALDVYNEMEVMKHDMATDEILEPEKEAIRLADLNIKNAYFNGLCTIVSNYIDVQQLIGSLQQANIESFEHAYE